MNKQFDSLLEGVNNNKECNENLALAKENILNFVNLQLKSFMDENRDSKSRKQEQLDQIAAHQKEALNSLLRKISTVRLSALEEMLEDLFGSLESEITVHLDSNRVEKLDKLVDTLFDRDSDLKEVKQEALNILNVGEVNFPDALRKTIETSQDNAALATLLDEISESATLSDGRSALETIRQRYLQKKESLSAASHNEKFLAEQLGKFTIEAVLEVQELVNKGIIPMEYLDFDDLDLDTYYDASNQDIKSSEQKKSTRIRI